jgi:hypothetical protein
MNGTSPASMRKSKYAEDVIGSDKFIAKLEEAEDEEIPKIVVKDHKFNFKGIFGSILVKKAEAKQNAISEPIPELTPQNQSLLQPNNKDDVDISQCYSSMVSNPFHIKIIEQNENSGLISKKSRNSSLKDASEKEFQNDDDIKIDSGNIAILNNTADTGADSNEHKESEEIKVHKKKKKKKKKKKTVPNEDAPNEPNEDASIEDASNEPNEDAPNGQVKNANTDIPEKNKMIVPEPIVESKIEVKPEEPHEDIKLHGLDSIERPVNLDNYLLRDQTNSVLNKFKKKKKKKRKNNVDETADHESKTGTAPTQESSVDKTTLGELKGVPKKIYERDTDSSVLGGSVKSSGKKSSNISNYSSPNNIPVMSGGDMDVKKYIKTVKDIESEKEQYKRDKNSNSSSSKDDKKKSRYD